MDAICNAIKNEIDNRIREYDKNDLFKLSLLNNSERKFTVKYCGAFQKVAFSIEAEYIGNDIKFSTYIDASNSTEASFEITDFMRWILKMSKKDLIKRIQYVLN